MTCIYDQYEDNLQDVMDDLVAKIEEYQQTHIAKTGEKLYEHLNARIKTDASMREKCVRKGCEPSAYTALKVMTDAIGLRIVCRFIDDLYETIAFIKSLSHVRVVKEKDYIRQAKTNGYRSYHMILEVETPFADVAGQMPGCYFVEVQLRTIAMDTWASLEHSMKYKKRVKNAALIEAELKRCADELASCDLSLQTIRDLINEGKEAS